MPVDNSFARRFWSMQINLFVPVLAGFLVLVTLGWLVVPVWIGRPLRCRLGWHRFIETEPGLYFQPVECSRCGLRIDDVNPGEIRRV